MRKYEDISLMCALHAVAEAGDADLTEVEAKFISECEPTASLLPVRVDGISQGRQSRVSVLGYGPNGKQGQVIWKRMGAGKQLTRAEAKDMWGRLGHYKATLESGGWKVPQLFHSTVVDVSRSESQVFSYEQFIPGGDGDTMLSDPLEPNFRKWHFVNEVLRVLYTYPADRLSRCKIAGQTLSLLPHGLDLKAANFVLERETNALYFVDLFGTKELDESGNWRIYTPKIDLLPPDNLRAVCATREGCLLRFWRLARRLWEPEKERRRLLTRQLLEYLAALEPPQHEFELIEREIRAGYPWLTELYSERQI